MTPTEIIQQTSLAMNKIGQLFYFHPDTLAKGKESGLDGFRFYMLGRGGVLGDVEAPVITSAFGYFHPAVVAKIWNSAKTKLDPREAATIYGLCCADVGRSTFGGLDLGGFNDAAVAIIDATDPAGLSLYAGWAAEPLADDDPGRALQLAAVLRELRGSAHIIALRSVGLHPSIAHAVKRPADTATFGWDPAPAVTDAHRASHVAADELTDKILVDSYATLTADQAEAFVAGTDAMLSALG